MELLDNINDKCWAMLDWLWDKGIPIGSVFEKYNLPPILFPLLIILIILLVFWLVSAPGGGPSCGDGICTDFEEDCLSCEQDCGACRSTEPLPPTEKISVIVELSETPGAEITVLLLDKDDTVLDTQSGKRSTFTFSDITPQIIQASIVCPNGKSQTGRPRTVDVSSNSLYVSLPIGCSDYLGDDGPGKGDPIPTYGTVVVTVKDSSTNGTIDATVNVLRTSDDIVEDTTTTISGVATLNPRADNRYYVTASKVGYYDFSGKTDVFYMVAGASLDKSISLIPLTNDPEDPTNPDPIVEDPKETGNLTVCAASGSDDMEEGTLIVNQVGGNRLDSAHLTPSDDGCITFEIDSGKNVKATLINPPSDCISPDFSEDVLIKPGEEETIYLDVVCGDVGYIKVMVQNKEGDILTQDATITLWNVDSDEQIPGTASDSSLAVGDDGYTEEITVPINTNIQAIATEVPIAYLDTESKEITVKSKEHSTIAIYLAEVPIEDFSFNGVTLVYSSVFPNMPVRVYMENITYNQTELTNRNSEVTMRIGSNLYEAEYVPETA